ncbi:MAG: hypothetical protein E7345_00925 [Clostridiales bacterium]|nr:hypothetical protein [Clostridiales bacterium]
MKYWSKSALSIYRYLESMAETVDKRILKTGTSSNSEGLQRYQSTYLQTGQMIEFIERKRKLINLKVAVEDALTGISLNDRRLLVLTFVDGVTSVIVAELMNISLRTFFRRKVSALQSFTNKMIELGYDENFFQDYETEPWFLGVYNEIVSSNIADDFLKRVVVGRMFNQVSKVCVIDNSNICH